MLDPEQNDTFRDHYLDVPFDLSEVLFITTANVLDPIPPALRDRMEVLEMPGYTEEEKLTIAREHLVEKQVQNHGLTPEQFTFTDEALRAVIRGYTREAGVRNLEREIGALCRKAARRRAEGDETPLDGHAGRRRRDARRAAFLDEEMEERTKNPGVAIGLAWTPAGGDVLFIEASRMAGTGTLTLTGSARRRDEGVGARGAVLVPRARRRIRRRPGLLQERRDPPPRAVGRDSEGRPVGGRDDGRRRWCRS